MAVLFEWKGGGQGNYYELVYNVNQNNVGVFVCEYIHKLVHVSTISPKPLLDLCLLLLLLLNYDIYLCPLYLNVCTCVHFSTQAKGFQHRTSFLKKSVIIRVTCPCVIHFQGIVRFVVVSCPSYANHLCPLYLIDYCLHIVPVSTISTILYRVHFVSKAFNFTCTPPGIDP